MSISLAAISSEKTKPLSVGSLVTDYLKALELAYVENEREGFIYQNGKGVLGLAFLGDPPQPGMNPDHWDIQQHSLAGKAITVIKILHENSSDSLQKLQKEIKGALSVDSQVVALESTGLWGVFQEDFAKAPPSLTEKGSIYFPVGQISNYFAEGDSFTQTYGDDSRGIEFANTLPEASYWEIRDKYFSTFLDQGKLEEFVRQDGTGLLHFTIALMEKDKQLLMVLLQHESAKGCRFLEYRGKRVFCSDDELLRALRPLRYPEAEIKRPNRPLKAILALN